MSSIRRWYAPWSTSSSTDARPRRSSGVSSRSSGRAAFPSAKAIAEADFEALRGAGLSRSKAASIQDIARRARAGELPTVAAAAELDDEELVRRLTVARGVGRWTAEMVLMFRLGRLDVMPATDFGVRKGFGRLFGTGEPSEPSAVIERAERWRPYRSVASWYLWRATEIDLATLVGR